MFTGIPHSEIDAVWPVIAPWIGEACLRAKGRYDAEDVRQWLLKRDWQLWVFYDPEIIACCCTEIVDYPQKRYCRVAMAAGAGLHKWARHMQTIESWAISKGCHGMELGGRLGWKRIFPEWENNNLFLEKEF